MEVTSTITSAVQRLPRPLQGLCLSCWRHWHSNWSTLLCVPSTPASMDSRCGELLRRHQAGAALMILSWVLDPASGAGWGTRIPMHQAQLWLLLAVNGVLWRQVLFASPCWEGAMVQYLAHACVHYTLGMMFLGLRSWHAFQTWVSVPVDVAGPWKAAAAAFIWLPRQPAVLLVHLSAAWVLLSTVETTVTGIVVGNEWFVLQQYLRGCKLLSLQGETLQGVLGNQGVWPGPPIVGLAPFLRAYGVNEFLWVCLFRSSSGHSCQLPRAVHCVQCAGGGCCCSQAAQRTPAGHVCRLLDVRCQQLRGQVLRWRADTCQLSRQRLLQHRSVCNAPHLRRAAALGAAKSTKAWAGWIAVWCALMRPGVSCCSRAVT